MIKRILSGCSLVLVVGLGACAAPPGPNNVAVQSGAPVTRNITPTDEAFACVKSKLAAANSGPVRIAVGNVKDYTGKFSNDAAAGGYKITQGGSLMVMSALGKLAPYVQMVERFDPSITEYELRLSKDNLIRDSVDATTTRAIGAGAIIGSDFYILGGVTEANYDIQSGGLSLAVNVVGGSAQYAVMNVAADLRIVNTRNSMVIKTSNMQKQAAGEEIRGNIFRFFGSSLVDFDGGIKNQEPLQLGVRTMLEAEVIDLVSGISNVDLSDCLDKAQARFTPQQTAQADQATAPRVAKQD